MSHLSKGMVMVASALSQLLFSCTLFLYTDVSVSKCGVVLFQEGVLHLYYTVYKLPIPTPEITITEAKDEQHQADDSRPSSLFSKASLLGSNSMDSSLPHDLSPLELIATVANDISSFQERENRGLKRKHEESVLYDNDDETSSSGSQIKRSVERAIDICANSTKSSSSDASKISSQINQPVSFRQHIARDTTQGLVSTNTKALSTNSCAPVQTEHTMTQAPQADRKKHMPSARQTTEKPKKKDTASQCDPNTKKGRVDVRTSGNKACNYSKSDVTDSQKLEANNNSKSATKSLESAIKVDAGKTRAVSNTDNAPNTKRKLLTNQTNAKPSGVVKPSNKHHASNAKPSGVVKPSSKHDATNAKPSGVVKPSSKHDATNAKPSGVVKPSSKHDASNANIDVTQLPTNKATSKIKHISSKELPKDTNIIEKQDIARTIVGTKETQQTSLDSKTKPPETLPTTKKSSDIKRPLEKRPLFKKTSNNKPSSINQSSTFVSAESLSKLPGTPVDDKKDGKTQSRTGHRILNVSKTNTYVHSSDGNDNKQGNGCKTLDSHIVSADANSKKTESAILKMEPPMRNMEKKVNSTDSVVAKYEHSNTRYETYNKKVKRKPNTQDSIAKTADNKTVSADKVLNTRTDCSDSSVQKTDSIGKQVDTHSKFPDSVIRKNDTGVRKVESVTKRTSAECSRDPVPASGDVKTATSTEVHKARVKESSISGQAQEPKVNGHATSEDS